LAVSETTKQNLARYVPSIPRERVIVRHQGLQDDFRQTDREERRRRFRSKHGLNGSFTVFHIGNDSWHKNFRGVLEGFFQAGLENAKLLKIGPIGEADRRRIADLELAGSIVNIGYVDDNELADAFNSADVLVFPSYGEGFGLPPVEAMAIGLPVVASTRESLPEIGGDAVLYTEPDDYPSIADAIRRVATDDVLRSGLIAKGLQRSRLFNWRNVTEGILSFFPEYEGKEYRNGAQL
jgi:glycosyltransferase involved in cell wall biosynthesis